MPQSDHAAEVRNWTPDRLSDLSGRTIIVTGGNAGLGLAASKIMAGKGAHIVIACRNPEKGRAAVAEIDAVGPASVDLVTLDLSRMASVRDAANDILSRFERIDALLNNAGIMQTPETRTEDGFELQLATNHLGHFLLSGLLYERILASQGRIAPVASIAHKFGALHFDDLMLERGYTPTKAYGQSKLANLVFGLELHRRLQAAGSPVKSITSHPGYSSTQLQSTGPRGALNALYKVLNPMLAQPAEAGATPLVLAAAGDEAQSGEYYGPTGFGDARGPVGVARMTRAARDESAGERLWAESERVLDYQWPLAGA